MLADQAYHLLISVTPAGEGSRRRLYYSLSDVIRRTDFGNDPLGDWQGRNPGRHAIWLQWSPLAGVQPSGETEGASALEAEILRGVQVAIRIEDGYYGEDSSHINFAPKEVESE